MPLIRGFYFDSLRLLFWFDLFLEARAEILGKRLLGFWKAPKGHFEINWPLTTLLQLLILFDFNEAMNVLMLLNF